jgi:hypothetical protein
MLRKKGGCFGWLIVVAILVVSAPCVYAQTASTGALSGTVTDASGAVVPNAAVTAVSASGQSRSVTTGTDGTYHLTLLPPGSYSLKFEAPGFNTAEIPSVNVNVTETSVLNQALAVGTQTQQVVVQGESEVVQTSNATLGDVVTSGAASGLPLTTRNYTNLLGLSTGANAAVFNATALGKGTTDIAVNGSSTSQNNVQMDGASITNNAASGTLTENGLNPGLGLVNPDAISEFKIQTSLFDAGYGRNPGASVNVVTKSGTNDFHGSAFEFFRNTALNANDFFRNQSPPIGGLPNNSRQVLDQNQFGGVVGGPVKKDKLFFFASYQGTRQINGASSQGYSAPFLLPIPSNRSSSAALQSALGAEFCPGGPDGGTNTIGGTQVLCSGANINPVALNLLEIKNPDGTYYIPSGPSTISSTTGKTVGQATTFTIPARFREDQALGNVDYVINSRNTLSARYFYTYDPGNWPFSCGAGGGAPGICYPDTDITSRIANHYSNLKLTSILSNHLVNEARISIQRNSVNAELNDSFTATQAGITPVQPSDNVLPLITVTGLFSIGSAQNYPNIKTITNWEAADELSWTHGKHTMRFGVEGERDRFNLDISGISNGNLTFQTFQDLLLGLPGCAPGTTAAACAASATAGTTNGTFSSNISSSGTFTAVTAPTGPVHSFRTPYGAAYVQDDIKVKPQFTLNLGLRWEYISLLYDQLGDASNVWTSLINTVPIPGSSPATGTLAGYVIPSNWNFSANPAAPVGGLFQNNHKGVTNSNTPLTDFAPRAGFAWSPLASSRLVVRGGGGYFYDRVGEGNYDVGPNQGEPYATTVAASGAANYYSTLAVPYENVGLEWTPRWVNFASGTTSNISNIIVDQNFKTPVVYEWNLFAQYEFVPEWTLEVGYVGSRGVHQYASRTLNEAQLVGNPLGTNIYNAPGIAAGLVTTNTVANAALRTPFLGYAPLGLSDSGTFADTKFNSLQATLRKRFSHGLQAQAAYTFSRAFNSVFTLDDPNYSVYGLNSAYHPQRLAISYLWNLPLGAHQGLLDKLTSGWSVSGVTVAQDGTPLTPTDTRGGTIYGFGPGAAVLSTAEYAAGMGAANVASAGSVQQRLGGANGGGGWFNKAAFGTTPVIGNGTGYGDGGIGTVLGPGQFNWDMSLTKTTKVGGLREDATLQFRTEFFNTFNHPQFSNPAVVDVSKATFGTITSTSVNPRLIQFALKYLF